MVLRSLIANRWKTRSNRGRLAHEMSDGSFVGRGSAAPRRINLRLILAARINERITYA